MRASLTQDKENLLPIDTSFSRKSFAKELTQKSYMDSEAQSSDHMAGTGLLESRNLRTPSTSYLRGPERIGSSHKKRIPLAEKPLTRNNLVSTPTHFGSSLVNEVIGSSENRATSESARKKEEMRRAAPTQQLDCVNIDDAITFRDKKLKFSEARKELYRYVESLGIERRKALETMVHAVLEDENQLECWSCILMTEFKEISALRPQDRTQVRNLRRLTYSLVSFFPQKTNKKNGQYLRMWLVYAALQALEDIDDAKDTFKYLKGKGIGEEDAVFYVEYAAFEYQCVHDISKARILLKKGMDRGCQPSDLLAAATNAVAAGKTPCSELFSRVAKLLNEDKMSAEPREETPHRQTLESNQNTMSHSHRILTCTDTIRSALSCSSHSSGSDGATSHSLSKTTDHATQPIRSEELLGRINDFQLIQTPPVPSHAPQKLDSIGARTYDQVDRSLEKAGEQAVHRLEATRIQIQSKQDRKDAEDISFRTPQIPNLASSVLETPTIRLREEDCKSVDTRSKKLRRVPLTNLMKSGRALRISSTCEQRIENDMEGPDLQITKHSHGDDERYSFTEKDTNLSNQPNHLMRSKGSSDFDAQTKQEHQDASNTAHNIQGAKNCSEGRLSFAKENAKLESVKLDSESLISSETKPTNPVAKKAEGNSAVSNILSEAVVKEAMRAEVKNVNSEASVREPESSRSPLSFANQSVSQQRKPKDTTVTVNGLDYTLLELVGKGGSSKVFKVMSSDRKIYALKRIKLEGKDPEAAKGFMDEIKLLQRLKGKPSIIQIVDWEAQCNGSLLLVLLEYGEIDLASLLARREKTRQVRGESGVDENFIRMNWQQMLEAVATIHDERIVHSDLKPANFLVVQGILKLIDFGIAKALQADTTNIVREGQVGTLNYMSPEAICSQPIDADQSKIKIGRQSDIWSLGCILYQMVYGRTPFSHLPFMRKLHAIANPRVAIEFPACASPELLHTMQRCLERDPNKRATMSELMNDPFLFPNKSSRPNVNVDTLIRMDQLKKILKDLPLGLTEEATREILARAEVLSRGGSEMPREESSEK